MLNVDIRSMRYPTASDGQDLIGSLRLQVAKGELVSLLGRSGAGKTTLLRIIAGIERRFAGQITVDDVPITKPSLSVQMLFQDSRLLPWKTVFQNVAFATDDPSGNKARSEIMAWLERVGLHGKKDEWPKSLSGGEAARVAIARALVASPRVFLLDEPFGNLDLVTRFEVQGELLRDLQVTQPATLLVSHNIDDAVFMSDQIHVLSSRPMQISRSFRVSAPRPRHRGQSELSKIAAEIADYLSSQTRGSSVHAVD